MEQSPEKSESVSPREKAAGSEDMDTASSAKTKSTLASRITPLVTSPTADKEDPVASQVKYMPGTWKMIMLEIEI